MPFDPAQVCAAAWFIRCGAQWQTGASAWNRSMIDFAAAARA
jgi:hypothetical protein